MPRYHFHVHDGRDFPDEIGDKLPDLDAARAMAVKLSGDCLRDHGCDFWNDEEWAMDVTDRRGLILFSLHFIATAGAGTHAASSGRGSGQATSAL